MRTTSGIRATLAALALIVPTVGCFSADHESASAALNGGGDQCTFTQGFWKNHPDAWPTSSLRLGTVTYTKDQLLAIFNQPVRGNGLTSLAHQLIAAKLNLRIDAPDADIADEISAAHALIGDLVVPPIGSGFLATSVTSALVSTLDEFNNSELSGDECVVCGDGYTEGREQCDDGNTESGDGCSSKCKLEPTCGDGNLDYGEDCDDGNTVGGDGCSATCTCE